MPPHPYHTESSQGTFLNAASPHHTQMNRNMDLTQWEVSASIIFSFSPGLTNFKSGKSFLHSFTYYRCKVRQNLKSEDIWHRNQYHPQFKYIKSKSGTWEEKVLEAVSGQDRGIYTTNFNFIGHRKRTKELREIKENQYSYWSSTGTSLASRN